MQLEVRLQSYARDPLERIVRPPATPSGRNGNSVDANDEIRRERLRGDVAHGRGRFAGVGERFRPPVGCLLDGFVANVHELLGARRAQCRVHLDAP